MIERAPLPEAAFVDPDEPTRCVQCNAVCIWHQVNHCRSELIDVQTGDRHWLVCTFGDHRKVRGRPNWT